VTLIVIKTARSDKDEAAAELWLVCFHQTNTDKVINKGLHLPSVQTVTLKSYVPAWNLDSFYYGRPLIAYPGG
jgi:hypothetical protein